MAKKKKSLSTKKYDVPVDDFNGYTETVAEMLEKVDLQPLALDIGLAKRLTGKPVVFDESCQDALKLLVTEGIAADFGEEGHARGFKWRAAVKL